MNTFYVKKVLVLLMLINSILIVVGLFPASAFASEQDPFTWRIEDVSSTTHSAGSSPHLTIALAANNDPEEQDLESLSLTWPDGLIPISDSSKYCNLAQNGEGVYHCSNPNAQKVGSQTIEQSFTFGIEFSATLTSSTYAEEALPGEAARLVSIPDLLSIPGFGEIPGDELPEVVSESSVLLRDNGSGINTLVEDIPTEISVDLGWGPTTVPIHVHRLETTIDGSQKTSSGTPVLTIPAICDPVSFDATFTSYGDDGISNSGDEQVRTETEPFSITDCQGIPYNPKVNLSLTSSIAGSTSNLVTSADSNATDALTKDMHITLPPGFGMAPTGTSACSAAQVAVASCQSSSQLGTVSVSSVLSPTPMLGAIHQTESQGDAVGIAVFLTASFGDIQLSGTLRQTAEGGVEMAFTDFPPLGGMGSVEINMNSASGGSLQNPWVCGFYNATSTYKSYNLRQVSTVHPLDIIGCHAQKIDTDLSVKLWKPRNNRYTDMRLKVAQHPRQVADKATFYLPKDLKFRFKGHKKKDPLAYVEFWDDKKVKRAKLYRYTTKRKSRKKKGPSNRRSIKTARKSNRKSKSKKSSSLKLKAKNKQLKKLRVTFSKIKKYTKISMRNIPKDKELADFSIRLFGKRTRMVRTFKRCVRHRNLEFKVKVDSGSGERGESSDKQRVKCLQKRVSKKRRLE